MKTKKLSSSVFPKLFAIVVMAALFVTVSYAGTASAETISTVYLCDKTVEIQLSSGIWLFADTSDTNVPTSEKTVDRIYSMALAAWLAKKEVSFYYPRTSQTWLPCISSAQAYRINVLQVK